MRVTYDAKIDAAYIYLADASKELETREVDHDINLDFDAANRLVGIEVLDASKRLDLAYLRSIAGEFGPQQFSWPKLTHELSLLKQQSVPVETQPQRIKNWIKEIGEDYVVLLSERSRSGRTRTITLKMLGNTNLESHRKARRSRIVLALWRIGGYECPG